MIHCSTGRRDHLKTAATVGEHEAGSVVSNRSTQRFASDVSRSTTSKSPTSVSATSTNAGGHGVFPYCDGGIRRVERAEMCSVDHQHDAGAGDLDGVDTFVHEPTGSRARRRQSYNLALCRSGRY